MTALTWLAETLHFSGEQIGLAACGIARFQGVIMLGHGRLRPIADRRWRGIRRTSVVPGVVSGNEMVDLSAAADAGDTVAKLKSFIIERSLPLWSGEGWYRASGGFVDRLDGEGRADRLAPRRTFVQARQIPKCSTGLWLTITVRLCLLTR